MNAGAPTPETPTRVLLLGSTGSIGTQALEVIEQANRRRPGRFAVVGLAAGGGDPDRLAAQARGFGVDAGRVAVADPAAAARVADLLDAPVRAGPDATTDLVRETPADVVLNALVGSLGLHPTLAVLATGSRLALANKESLVAGGDLVRAAAAPGQIVPVDSEHSALTQCLRSGTTAEVARLVLTASGGPFRGWSADALRAVTPEQAAAHPTWSMGQMNTLNSATLVNKGLELIETHLLFDVPYADIDVVVHPQSIIHSMVTFRDGSTIAQASPPSMKLPISLALGWPERMAGAAPALDFGPVAAPTAWTFEPVDAAVFPAIDLARAAGEAGGGCTAVYNAANEEAAAEFLRGRLHFPDIVGVVAAVLDEHAADAPAPGTVDDVVALEERARSRARELAQLRRR